MGSTPVWLEKVSHNWFGEKFTTLTAPVEVEVKMSSHCLNAMCRHGAGSPQAERAAGRGQPGMTSQKRG